MSKFAFHYIKSQHHFEIKVDGAIGGVGPTGDTVEVSVYTERHPIPKVTVHEMEEVEGGRNVLGPEIRDLREGREGVVRIVQATLHLSLQQAQFFHTWLGEHIENLEKFDGQNNGS